MYFHKNLGTYVFEYLVTLFIKQVNRMGDGGWNMYNTKLLTTTKQFYLELLNIRTTSTMNFFATSSKASIRPAYKYTKKEINSLHSGVNYSRLHCFMRLISINIKDVIIHKVKTSQYLLFVFFAFEIIW